MVYKPNLWRFVQEKSSWKFTYEEKEDMKQIVSRGHTRPLTEISFVEDGIDKTILVSSAHDKTPQIRNGETGDWIGSFIGHKGAVWSAKVDPLTRTLAATASGDFSSKLWCANTGKELHEFKHKHVVRSVDFSADSLKIATGCQDGLIRIFDTCQPEVMPQELKISQSSVDGIMKIQYSPADNNIIIVGKKSSEVEKYDTRVNPTEGPVQTFKVSSKDCVIMDFECSNNHDLLLAASGTKVFSFQFSTMQLIREFQMPSPMTFQNEGGVSLSLDGKRFFAGASDLWLREFDLETGELLRVLKGHHGPVRCVRHHPTNSQVLASGSEDGTIRLWDLNFSI